MQFHTFLLLLLLLYAVFVLIVIYFYCILHVLLSCGAAQLTFTVNVVDCLHWHEGTYSIIQFYWNKSSYISKNTIKNVKICCWLFSKDFWGEKIAAAEVYIQLLMLHCPYHLKRSSNHRLVTKCPGQPKPPTLSVDPKGRWASLYVFACLCVCMSLKRVSLTFPTYWICSNTLNLFRLKKRKMII